MIPRCSWCNHILWPFQKLSAGRSMHRRCSMYVERITQETQEQYALHQASLRWQEEDRL